MKNNIKIIWQGTLSYVFYYVGAFVGRVMFALDCGSLYKYYKWFMCKSLEYDTKNRLWKKESEK